MRQAGVLAAAGLYALDRYVDQMQLDHANAKRLAIGLQALPGIELKWDEPETNMIFFDISGTALTASELSRELMNHGISIGAESDTELRAVLHLDVDAASVDTTIQTIGQIVSK